MDGDSAMMPIWVQKNIRVCALGFLFVFYFQKKFIVRALGLYAILDLEKNSEYVHWSFSTFSILENRLGRAFGRYADLGSEKYLSMRIGLFDCVSILKKLYRTSNWPLRHFGFRKNSKFVLCVFSSFSILEIRHGR